MTRRNGIAVLMGVELILNAANLNFVAFSRFGGMNMDGHIFSLFVIVLAASAALLEALIPPSNAAILYSAFTYVPVSQTFAAGVIPGIILLFFMIALVLFKCRNIKRHKPATNYEKLILGLKAFP